MPSRRSQEFVSQTPHGQNSWEGGQPLWGGISVQRMSHFVPFGRENPQTVRKTDKEDQKKGIEKVIEESLKNRRTPQKLWNSETNNHSKRKDIWKRERRAQRKIKVKRWKAQKINRRRKEETEIRTVKAHNIKARIRQNVCNLSDQESQHGQSDMWSHLYLSWLHKAK